MVDRAASDDEGNPKCRALDSGSLHGLPPGILEPQDPTSDDLEHVQGRHRLEQEARGGGAEVRILRVSVPTQMEMMLPVHPPVVRDLIKDPGTDEPVGEAVVPAAVGVQVMVPSLMHESHEAAHPEACDHDTGRQREEPKRPAPHGTRSPHQTDACEQPEVAERDVPPRLTVDGDEPGLQFRPGTPMGLACRVEVRRAGAGVRPLIGPPPTVRTTAPARVSAEEWSTWVDSTRHDPGRCSRADRSGRPCSPVERQQHAELHRMEAPGPQSVPGPVESPVRVRAR